MCLMLAVRRQQLVSWQQPTEQLPMTSTSFLPFVSDVTVSIQLIVLSYQD